MNENRAHEICNLEPETQNPELRFLPTKAKNEYGLKTYGKRGCDSNPGFA
jgi:hypothetical protein